MPMPRPIEFGPQFCGTLGEGVTAEWLLPDGVGGYAMGTVCGLRTRRYHALLVVADPTGAFGRRQIGLAALDPVVTLPSGTAVRLGVHEWTSGDVSPSGHTYLENFDLSDGLPRWRFRIGETVLQREIATTHGRPGVGVVYTLLAGGPVRLSVEALCTWRDAHGERHDDGAGLPVTHHADGAVVEDAYRIAGSGWQPGGKWYSGAHLREEAARELASDEDLWYAGSFTYDLEVGAAAQITAWAGDLDDPPPPALTIVESARRRAREIVDAAAPADEIDAALVLAADAFIVRAGGTRPDVIAGYPWFGAWSRDTMTSYEGLFLATNRASEGRDLLRSYAATLSDGMLANTADTGTLEYNTVDATLWFLHAIGRHVDRTGDLDLAAELVPRMHEIVAAHVRGARYGIAVDPGDGLLTQGADGLALTWMDARTDGHVVTPRIGKPVEVNALWVNGLATITALSARIAADTSDIEGLHDRALASFRKRFPCGDEGLFDVLDGPNGDDASVRPNQLLAWSLPYAPMAGPNAVPPHVGDLLTPLGLRSLVPTDPAYHGLHRGGPVARDLAYHQGTVWPWLIGPYVDATGQRDTVLDGLAAHLGEFGLGSVSETADGDPPHGATGCPFQAWSVAEMLRIRTTR